MQAWFVALAIAACAAPFCASSTWAQTTPSPRTPRPPPAVQPDKAAKPLAPVALVNAGFESSAQGLAGSPEGWFAVQHAGPTSYTFAPDATVRRSGERSLRVENVGPEPFGAVYQTIPAMPHRGKTLRLSAWLRTEGTTGNRFGSGAGLKLHSVRGGYPLEVAEMRRDAVHGSSDWTRYEITLKVPAEADQIEAGLVLFGPGKVWIDDVALDVVADAAPRPAGAEGGTPRAQPVPR